MLTRTAAALSFVIAVGFAGTPSSASPAAPPPPMEQVERGKALVWSIACNDCHTPKKMGPRGPELDESRLLSGHRETPVLPPPPALPPGPWGIVTNLELTAWSGPWGVTYTANLRPTRRPDWACGPSRTSSGPCAWAATWGPRARSSRPCPGRSTAASPTTT